MTTTISINPDAFTRASDPNRWINTTYALEMMNTDSRHRAERSRGTMASLGFVDADKYPLGTGDVGGGSVPMSAVYTREARTVRPFLAKRQKLNSNELTRIASAPAPTNSAANIRATAGDYDPMVNADPAEAFEYAAATADAKRKHAVGGGAGRRKARGGVTYGAGGRGGRGGGCPCGCGGS